MANFKGNEETKFELLLELKETDKVAVALHIVVSLRHVIDKAGAAQHAYKEHHAYNLMNDHNLSEEI